MKNFNCDEYFSKPIIEQCASDGHSCIYHSLCMCNTITQCVSMCVVMCLDIVDMCSKCAMTAIQYNKLNEFDFQFSEMEKFRGSGKIFIMGKNSIG